MSEEKNSLEKNESTVLNETEMGDISIQDGVIASIAHRAAVNVEGVLRLAGNSIINSVAELVGNRRMQSRNISVNFGEDGDVSIEVKVVLKFGCCIPQVAKNIQAAVITDVEAATGMNVTGVHVVVKGIEEETAAEEDNESDE